MTATAKICIDARLTSGMGGGVEQFLIGLASGLSSLTDGEEEYFFLMNGNSSEWLAPFLNGSCKALPLKRGFRSQLGHFARGMLPFLGRVRSGSMARSLVGEVRPYTYSSVENSEFDLVHFTLQSAFSTSLPSIYHPHDLQHLHMPEFFPPEEIEFRDRNYRYFCRKAAKVAVASSWVKRDLVENLGLSPDKIVVVPLAPPTDAYERVSESDVEDVRLEYALPEKFLYYPAQTWEHKNHLALLEAIDNIRREHGVVIPLVFSGAKTVHAENIVQKAVELGLAEQVKLLGFVSSRTIQCLYRSAHGVVLPSRFEAASFPMWEAFSAGVPVACSSVTSLPEQAGQAALVFDPNDVASIADSVLRLWCDDSVRAKLVSNGIDRVSQFTWRETALHFRALYRSLLGTELNQEDRTRLYSQPIM